MEKSVIEPDDKKYYFKVFGLTLYRDTIFAGNFTHYGKVHTINNFMRLVGLLLVYYNFNSDTILKFILMFIGMIMVGTNVVPLTKKEVYIKVW